MINELVKQFSTQIQTFLLIMTLINGILHLIFAGAVAHDAGNMNQTGQKTVLVSAATWAFATLIGGVFTATIYWLLHHSTLTRPIVREIRYDQP
ncbi:hypothetical protein OQJ18_06500 [Fluoribacter dumoffii]|uniref:Uncharacterized protein n=1 Tax=Fluoribacter dumoffii TaxID=463 RepID=A0A377G889_9GAMM|nr:hypothetical protein [Fluoribacter dumoffii]KTC89908.1 hypothetical protein Ldum_0976 [Fluoribacter dumoffii NY 23]MCW8385206.1 hypothetical protein [Fluoribacter dumoffii]MCW8418260.1 hypothetical protein [Fluoribacter dumoffii]MCW8453898.1 hypothetical protein [Fluoribacter dumoffii]MCW8462031.1 hypothetical protein [Fluoribacter dumoffii]